MAVAKQPLLDAVLLLEQFHCLYQRASVTLGHLRVPKPTEAFCFLLPENPTSIIQFRYPRIPLSTQSGT